MAENKRHHFVPQLYLKLFSNNTKTITVFSLSLNKIVSPNAPIARQCYKNYFYSKNPKIEKKISNIESISKPIIDQILKTKTLPSKNMKEYYRLLIFVLYQSGRTLFAANQRNEQIDKISKILLKKLIQLKKTKDIDCSDVDKVSIKYKQPAIQSLQRVSETFPLLFDLNCKLVLNLTKTEFITSDNPVILYNQYYFKQKSSYCGYASKGLIIIFPLNPQTCLLLYDSNMYKVGSKKPNKPVICRNTDEINEINILQTINADKAIFTKSMESKYLKYILSKARNYRSSEKSNVEEKEAIVKDMGKQSIIFISRPKCKYKITLSFLKNRKKIPRKYLTQKLVRDPYLVSLHKEFLKKVNEKKYKNSEWYRFLKDKIQDFT